MKSKNNALQIPRYSWLIAVIPGVLLILLAEYISLLQEQALQANQRKSLNSVLLNLSTQLLQELDGAVYFSIGLRSYIETTGGREPEIAPWLTNLQLKGRHIRNIGLAPGNRITYIYPREGNEAALGLYYPDNSAQWPSVKAVIDSRKAKLVGPFPLTQGGRGFAYREPVFLDKGDYWGLISIILDADTLLASLANPSVGLRVQIQDEETGQMIVSQSVTQQDVIESRSITLLGRRFSISVIDQAAEIPITIKLIKFGGWVLGISVSLLLAFVLQSIRARQIMAKAFQDTQQRFVRAFSFSPQGMAIVDDKGQWLEMNLMFSELVGVDHLEIQNKSLDDLFPGPDQKKLISTFETLCKPTSDHAAHEQFEAQFHSPKNEKLILLVSMGVCFASGDNRQIVIQLVDISERIKLEKMKSEFVSTISHELRTPITSIHGALSLVTRGKLGNLSRDVETLLQIAYRNSQRLGLLIDDLLDMEKLLAGKMVFNLQSCRVDQLVEQSLKENEQYAENLGVYYQLINRIGVESIQVDPLRFAQVMSNLLSNAAKFSPKGETIQIVLSLDMDRVKIEVKDKGPGIAEEFKERIFQKFSQADSSATRQKGGTGLGLAIVKEMVDRMGGRVGFESQLNQGSNFYTEWPIYVED